jgi:hypothetical protein
MLYALLVRIAVIAIDAACMLAGTGHAIRFSGARFWGRELPGNVFIPDFVVFVALE